MASAIDIVNVHAANHASSDPGVDLRKEIVVGLSKPLGHKSLPTMLLYDEHGLRLYDDITTKAPEYYPFPAEEDILKRHVVDIVRAMHALDGGQLKSEEVVVELGAG